VLVLAVSVAWFSQHAAHENLPDATIIGTKQAPLHTCPAVSCAVIGRLPLGQPVAILGGSTQGFSQVITNLGVGYIRDLYLQRDSGPASLDTPGDPGRGVGFEPAEGILGRLALLGNFIGSYSWVPRTLLTLSDEAARQDIEQASPAIAKTPGTPAARLFGLYAAPVVSG
jgi:hypothetical protein